VQKSLAEGFGLTVAEAMWKDRPVVASALGGICDQIEDGVSGILIDPSDLRAFGGAVVRLLSDKTAATAMGQAAQERVRTHFLGSRHLRQYLDLLTHLLHE
jgi:trehalose synthase